MTSARRGISRHLTYANVLATVTLFLVLGGGAAIASGKLGKNSVGSAQLKKNAVTTAKLKKNAVTTAKLAKNAVTAAKIKSGSIKGSDLSSALPYGHISHSAGGTTSVAIPESGVVYPLEGTTFTQAAGESLVAVGGLDFSVSPSCTGPEVFAEIVVDRSDPLKAAGESFFGPTGVIAVGEFESDAPGPLNSRLTISPFFFGTAFGVGPSAPAGHSLALVVGGECDSGSGITATSAGIDLIANGSV